MAEKDDDAAVEVDALRRRVAELEALLDDGANSSRELSRLEDAESQIFALLPDAILINRDGKIVFANPAAVKMFGAKSMADLVGMSSIELAHPDERERIQARRQSVLGGQFLDRNICRRLRLDGSEFMSESEGTRIIWKGAPALLNMLRDVTEQEQTRQALKESEERFRAVVDNSPTKIHIKDADGRYVLVNRQAEKLFGITDRNARGKTTHDIFATEQADAFAAHDQAVLQSGTTVEAEEEWLQEDRVRTFLTVKFPIRDHSGKIVSVGAIGTDITERKRAEEALQESERRYRDLIEGSDFGIQIGSPDRGRLFANLACAKLFGYDSVDEFLAVPRGDTIPDYDRDRVAGYREALIEGSMSATSYEMRALRKDGSIAPLQVFLRRIRWEGENAIHRTFIDLTERVRAEEARLESERRYHDLIENSGLGIHISLAMGGRIFINDALVHLLGYESSEEMFMMLPNKLVAAHDRGKVDQYRMAANELDRGSLQYDTDFLRKDGSIIPLHVIINKIVWNGEEAIQRTLIDLSERKQLEEQLHQAQKMEVVGHLTGGVAHDFNNILTAITGNLELAADQVEPTSEVGAMVERALGAAWRGATLTERLLAFSRRQALAPQVIHARALAEGMIDLLHRTLEESVSIEFIGSDDLWMCEADPSQLENAILNLAINARDAMPDGGKLTIETENISLDEDYATAQAEVTPGQYVMIAVTDTGAGMSQEILGQVFDPFFTTKEIGKGSGLGLSMVFGFVKQSGGHVTIYSEVGVGTTVKLYLPRSRGGKPASLPSGPLDVPRARGEIILVVEDDPSVRTLSVALLSDLGYGVLEAADGPAALLVLETSPQIDLLFTDVVLPGGMRGPELAAEITRRRPRITVLYTSGYTENAIVHQGRLDEGVDLLNKPFRRDDLARKVRAVLDKPRA
jgi:PAS domain S-box-containing protein